MPAYTVLSVTAVLVVLALEYFWWRTGTFRTARYWLSLAIIAVFMVLVDGWLTRPGHAVVTYAPSAVCGVRLPWGIPIEDYGFGWAMVTATILLWVVQGARPGLDADAREASPVVRSRARRSGPTSHQSTPTCRHRDAGDRVKHAAVTGAVDTTCRDCGGRSDRAGG